MCVNGLYNFVVVNVILGIEDEGKLMDKLRHGYLYIIIKMGRYIKEIKFK